MRKETFKVSEEDYKLVQRLKTIHKEDKQYNRLRSIEFNGLMIKRKEREIVFKQNQLQDGISLEKKEEFVDGKKPLFMLESDIESIEHDIKGLRDITKAAQEEYDKDK